MCVATLDPKSIWTSRIFRTLEYLCLIIVSLEKDKSYEWTIGAFFKALYDASYKTS